MIDRWENPLPPRESHTGALKAVSGGTLSHAPLQMQIGIFDLVFATKELDPSGKPICLEMQVRRGFLSESNHYPHGAILVGYPSTGLARTASPHCGSGEWAHKDGIFDIFRTN
jgi:hypothetical protein